MKTWIKGERLRQRRERYAPKGPCIDCGGHVDLVWDHIDPTTKFRDISRMLQSYTEERIELELSKCVVRCRSCNTKKSRVTNRVPGELLPEIRRLIGTGLSDQEISEATGVGRGTVWRIRNGEAWT